MSDFAIPTNIKQIGTIGDGLRIYVEDYVCTYLFQFAESGGYDERIALLIGKFMVIDSQPVLFINGAVQGKYAEEKNGLLYFTEKTDVYVNAMIAEFFSGMEVVGWMQSQPSYGIYLNQHYAAYHQRIFTRTYQVMFVLDPLERINTFYAWNEDRSGLAEVKGYFIYYDKNRGMHEYMLRNKTSGNKTNVYMTQQPTFVEVTHMERAEEAGINAGASTGTGIDPEMEHVVSTRGMYGGTWGSDMRERNTRSEMQHAYGRYDHEIGEAGTADAVSTAGMASMRGGMSAAETTNNADAVHATASGITEVKGSTGSTVATDTIGTTETTGATGAAGASGASGIAGAAGTSGGVSTGGAARATSAAAGTARLRGLSGIIGSSHAKTRHAGYTGYSERTGQIGYSGSIEHTGESGHSVLSGSTGNPEDIIRRHQAERTRRRSHHEQRRTMNLLVSLSAVLFIVCFVMGAGLIQNQDRIAKMESQLSQLSTAYRNLFVQLSGDNAESVFAAQFEEDPTLGIDATGDSAATSDASERMAGDVTDAAGQSGQSSSGQVIEENGQAANPVNNPNENAATGMNGTSNEGASNDVINNAANTNDTSNTANASHSNEVNAENAANSTNNASTADTTANTTDANATSNAETPTANARVVPETYTIQPGDSLIAISIRFYGENTRVNDILAINGIGNADHIVAGKTIVLPRP